MDMPRHLIDVGGGRGWLDIESYGRQGPGRRDRLPQAQIEVIARTVHRTPEVMVKVLNRGGQNLGAVARHIDYLTRKGELEVENDDGQRLKGNGTEAVLLDDWDLVLDEERRTADLKPRGMRQAPKLVQRLMFSMPAGTPPQKVLTAVKNFAREEFGLKHRYAMVLHTDEPHPHVHLVVKAMGADGKRLNIRRETLREWRREFARHLREQGVAANATERAVRGETKPQKTDGIHRAALRGASTHYRRRVELVAEELARGGLKPEPGKNRLLATRREVVHGWSEVADSLVNQGQVELALAVRRFVDRMPPPRTEKESLAESLLEHVKSRTRVQKEFPTR
jgi:relaxase-like protein